MISPELFYALIFNCLLVIGIHAITRIGMIGEKISTFVVKLFGEFYSKPITECLPCMGSIHGIYFYLLFVNKGWLLLPFYLVALCGLNYIAVKILFYERD